MAMTRKWLAALGIEPEKIDEIITAHTEVTDSLKAERDKYKADAEELPFIQEELKTAQEKITQAEKDDYKAKYESEKAAHEKLKTDIAEKETTGRKTEALKKALKDAGYSEKGIEKITKYGVSLKDLDVNEKGEIKKSDEFFKNLETEWGEYKVQKTENHHTPATPPQGNTGGEGEKKSEAAKIVEGYMNSIYGKKED